MGMKKNPGKKMQDRKPPLKGLAWTSTQFTADLETLGAAWYYTWGTDPARLASDKRYVPMSREGRLVDLPPQYDGWLLVFNEPNNPEPFGANLDPAAAAARYLELRKALPQAKMVVGGLSAHALEWLRSFVGELQGRGERLPQTWHAHGYVEAWIEPSHLFGWWQEMQAITGGEYWITEFADTHGNPQSLDAIIAWIKSQTWIRRYAAFTSRARGDEPWFPAGWKVNLLDYHSGDLTALGEVYQRA